jgi:glycerol-3-phosphate dehydrogenase (NAD(P)+)
MKITILGAGAWGASLGKVLHENGHAVTLWDINAALLAELKQGHSERLLPGVKLPVDWRTETDFQSAVAGRECLVLAIPSQFFRDVALKLKGHPGIFVSVTKGIEFETGDTMSRILRGQTTADKVVALSGPSFAREVALGIPTTVSVASESATTAHTVQGLFHRPEFRIYRSTDILGVEYGGALKNVIAVGAGVSDGLGYGDNTKAGLVTPAWRGVRRAAGDFFGPERPWRSDADVFLQAEPQSRLGRAAGAR